MRRLIWGFAGHTYHIVGNLMHWLSVHNYVVIQNSKYTQVQISLCMNLYSFRYRFLNCSSFSAFKQKVRKRAKIRNRYNLITTPDPGYQWESNKLTIRHHKREQPFPSRWPQGPINRCARKHNKHRTEIHVIWIIHKRSTALERSVKIFYWRA